MIKIKVKCFSQVRYALGIDNLNLEFESGISTSQLEKFIRGKANGKLDGIL